MLDGIYSALPKMPNVNHIKILIDVPAELRYHRHNIREGSDDLEWHHLWDPVEDYYLKVIRPPSSFDLVVVNGELI